MASRSSLRLRSAPGTNGEISARCDKEEANFLALNLAKDSVQAHRSVYEARQFYRETIKQMIEGSPPEYIHKLTLEVPQANVGDPDEPIIEKG